MREMAKDLKIAPDGKAASRADALFIIYYEMGPGRTLAKLHKALIENGDSISVKTLKDYSRFFGWRRRVAELDGELRKVQAHQAVDAVAEINMRHARIGVAMQSVGEHQLNRFQDMIDNREALDIKPRDIISLIEYGAKLERLATGQSKDRKQIIEEVVNVAVREIASLFDRVNSIDDADGRRREFAEGADRIIESRVATG